MKILPMPGRHVPAVHELTSCTVAPGGRATCVVGPTTVFRADYLVLTKPRAFDVIDIKVGRTSQLGYWRIDVAENDPRYIEASALLPRMQGPVPAVLLHQLAALRLPLRFDTCQAHQEFVIEVENSSREAAELAGEIIGWSIERT